MLITFGTNMFYVDDIRHKTCFMLMGSGTKKMMSMAFGTKLFDVDDIRHKHVLC